MGLSVVLRSAVLVGSLQLARVSGCLWTVGWVIGLGPHNTQCCLELGRGEKVTHDVYIDLRAVKGGIARKSSFRVYVINKNNNKRQSFVCSL